MLLALLLMLLVRGGAGVLPKLVLWWPLGCQESCMRVQDGPGEAPEGLLGGRKIVVLHWYL